MNALRFFLCAFGLSLCNLVYAQPFPSKPIEIINAFAPGGANDLNVRALQAASERILGQPLVQIFKQGGGGIVGAAEVASATPDGYKLLVVTSGELTAAPNLTKASYSLDSFSFIARISSKPYGLVVRNDAPWNTARDMLKAIEENPDKFTIGTTPRGGMFLTAQHFIRRGHIRLTPVPYGGAGPALTGLLGSQIHSVWAPLAAADSHIRAGAMRVLAISGDTQLAGYPGVPTFKELGIEAPYVQWVGLVAPRETPADRLAFLREAFAKVVKDPAYMQLAQKFSIEIAYAPAGEFEKQVRDEDIAFKALVKDLGLTPK